MGMGALGPIPISEIKAYFDIYEVRDLDERDYFITTMQALDSIYLKHVNKSKGASAPSRKRKPK